MYYFKEDINLNDLEKTQKSLPPSPYLLVDMNPACHPDGSLSQKKLKEFNNLLVDYYLKKNYFGITILESIINTRRSNF